MVCPAAAQETRLGIEPQVEVTWPTSPGNSYQLQWSDTQGGPWTDLGISMAGDGSVHSLVDPVPPGRRFYQIQETVPATAPAPALPVNGGFETAVGGAAANWTLSGNQPPVRSADAAHSGSFGMRSLLQNNGTAPSEAGLSQRIAAQGGTIVAGQTYDFSFRAKQVSAGPSYIQQYQVQWLNSAGDILAGGTGLVNFTGSQDAWIRISRDDLTAPAGTTDARVVFRFVTGAVDGGHGEVFIDDVMLDSGASGSGTPEQVHVLPVNTRPVASLTWLTSHGMLYQPTASADMMTWRSLSSAITGDGGLKSLIVPMDITAEFFRLEMPDTVEPPPNPNGIVALFDSGTALEPGITLHTADALITRVGDRARDRHAREGMFQAYDHYLPWYWQQRTIGLEIIDRVAKGGSTITFNYQTLVPLGQPEFRAFFRGIGTVAEYHFNMLAPLVGPNLYSATLTSKLPENRPLQNGDRVEIEVSQFIQSPMNGRSNYYGTAILYVVGSGIVPWEAKGPLLDSHPLPETAWLGGRTTLPYQYSNEPSHRFKQTAGNISPENIQPFMQGRRLHHTDFGSGSHSEPGNPVFSMHAGKLGPRFIARSCVGCHVNNGRLSPPTEASAHRWPVIARGHC